MRVTIKNNELELFKKILNNGYAIGDGKDTDRIVRELKRANVPIHHGWDSDTRKVIIALEQPFQAEKKRRTLNKTLFDLEL